MRILMIADQFVPCVGGTERQAALLATTLAGRGHSVGVIAGRWAWTPPGLPNLPEVQVTELDVSGFPFRIRGLRKFANDRFATLLRRELRFRLRDGWDVVHCHFMRIGASIAVQEAGPLAIPVLAKETSSGMKNSFHGLRSVYRGTEISGVLLNGLRHVGVLNEVADAEYAALPFVDLRRHRIRNAVRIPQSQRAGRGDGRGRMVYIGRLRPEKGVAEAIRAFAEALELHERWEFLIFGDGPQEPELRARVADLPRGCDVELRGVTSRPIQELEGADLMVLPSRTEGMSNTLLEAMSVGIPTVATPVGSNPELLASGGGWIAADVSVSALTTALREAGLADRSELDRRGRAARETIERGYTPESVASLYESIYQEMAGRS